LGTTIYDAILTIVYANGYYAEMSKDKLARMVVRKIGNRWCKKQTAVQVIDYCADIGLLHDALLSQCIVTSVGIQERYYQVAVRQMRRQLYDDRFWLIDENGEPLLNSPFNRISSEENRISSEENQISSELMRTEIKGNKIKEKKEGEKEKPTPSSAYGEYHNVVLTEEEHAGLVNQFGADCVADYIGRISRYMHDNRRTYGGKHAAKIREWILQDQDTDRKQAKQGSSRNSRNRFHNYDQSGQDYDAIVNSLNNS
jgi:hypothetical protein